MGLFRALFVVLALVVCSGVTDASSSASVVLTVDNYQKVTEGRNVFIKFYAPWVRQTSKRETETLQYQNTSS